MANIYDVAKKAGVSKSTVSLVLNNRQSVKPETRILVEKAIRELNYVPNNNARCLMNRTMNCLAIIILTEGRLQRDYSFNEPILITAYNISDGIYKGLSETDYSIATEYFDISRADELPKLIERQRVDGAFVVGSFFDGKMMEKIQATGLPTIAVGIGSQTCCRHSVISDPGEGFRIGIERLISLGHRQICCMNSTKWMLSSADRTRGAKQAMENAGLTMPDSAILYAEKNIGKSAYERFGAYWQEGNRPSAIMAANNTLAYGVIRCLHDLGVRIPEDMSIVVYDDSQLCGYHTPALSAINIQKEKMGETAAQMMLRLLADQQCAEETVSVQPFYVERDSVLQLSNDKRSTLS